ncbi:hypothetical protein N7447_002680 [Penicillium robsamsonii]|uniref:uncharacterized protein n=1 Tax=Penicillium robsamsonii TaxID=1792511 RepID=UPI0025471F34|nr:uncharacterized protein N7447_002680 [Penicillium robsamsonii]KAJ5836654.1 hypothetical protein N7447_002680 [Penicillium robsamsonii]
MANPDRRARYTGWKMENELPETLKAKQSESLSSAEVQILLGFDPKIRAAFVKVFRKEGNIQT